MMRAYGNVKSGSPYMSTSGADPYSRMQIARASSLAIRATVMGDIFVFISPITPGSGSGSCKATCYPESSKSTHGYSISVQKKKHKSLFSFYF